MTELLKAKLNDSPAVRWGVLTVISLTMMCGYFLTDAMSPLMTMLEEEMSWTSQEFGIFNWPTAGSTSSCSCLSSEV